MQELGGGTLGGTNSGIKHDAAQGASFSSFQSSGRSCCFPRTFKHASNPNMA